MNVVDKFNIIEVHQHINVGSVCVIDILVNITVLLTCTLGTHGRLPLYEDAPLQATPPHLTC